MELSTWSINNLQTKIDPEKSRTGTCNSCRNNGFQNGAWRRRRSGLARLFDLEHKALQVLGFGQAQDHGMVGGGTAALKQPDPAMRIGSRGGDCTFEIGPAHVMGA